ncbi:MAG: hypothetical protein PHN78_01180 [Dehalococcoidales bacterium]|nr:hypothetical protein [Dehalococcoidales bacterium]
MRISILPKRALGWWSVGLAILSLIFMSPIFGVLRLVPIARQISLSPGQLKGIAFAIAGGAAFVTGLISIIRSKERSILVLLAMLIGLMAVAFVLGEILFPH